MYWPQNGELYWQQLVTFIHEPIPINAEQKVFRQYLKKFDSEFYKLLNLAKFETKHKLLLLGDLIGDRGPNDWFILLLLKTLKKNKVKFTINFSNHDYETYLWTVFNHFADDKLTGVINDTQRCSLLNFYECHQRATKTLKQRMHNVYLNSYLKRVRLFAFNYNRHTNTVTIATHAPGSLSLIKDIAGQFNINDPDCSTPHKLMRLLSKLNKLIRKNMLYNADYFIKKLCPPADTVNNEIHYLPIVRTIWGRHLELQNGRHQQQIDYKIKWICGHMGAPIDSEFVTNLDTSNLGKGDETSGQLCFSIDWC